MQSISEKPISTWRRGSRLSVVPESRPRLKSLQNSFIILSGAMPAPYIRRDYRLQISHSHRSKVDNAESDHEWRVGISASGGHRRGRPVGSTA